MGFFLTLPSAYGLQLQWEGQFWFDHHWLNNYQLDRGRPSSDADPTLYNAGGPYVPGTGEKNTMWYSAFLRLKPQVIVNDSIFLKSEFHVGSPIYGFMGRDFPTSGGEQYNFTGSQKQGAAISAMRFWATVVSDFGTVELGRAPIHWGMGAIWNSGDQLFDRYQSSGDMVRLITKFGNLYVTPALSKVSVGNSVSGALDTSMSPSSVPSLANPRPGNDDVTDYHLAIRYDNTEEDFDFGLMWTRRVGNAAQGSILTSPSTTTGSKKINYNLLDFYARKKLGRFGFGVEVPFYTGSIGGIDGSATDFDYRAVAVVLEGSYTSDRWDILLKGGHVPGQPSVNINGTDPNTGQPNAFVDGGAKYKPVYLHQNYGVGLIMFHYNLYGLAANNPDNLSAGQVRSPYDNPIVNANYLSLSPTFKIDKWSIKGTALAAWASQTAPNNPGNDPKKFYNHQRRQFFTTQAGNGAQQSFMGWEADLGFAFKWDDNLVFDWTTGLFFPGAYYKFANRPAPFHENSLSSFMFASQARLGITF
jgi:hypothetical protein